MKIIDFERKGNIVRFYLGDNDLQEYYGDDWNDAPYDCNAGTVYDRFVSGQIDVYFPFDCAVLEPCDGVLNCGYTKEDMIHNIVPCILVIPAKELEKHPWKERDFSWWLGSRPAVSFYFGDDAISKLSDYPEYWMNFDFKKWEDGKPVEECSEGIAA